MCAAIETIEEQKSSAVVLLHGLWLNGWELKPLARRLRRCGFRPRVFPYADVRREPAHNARLLQQWLAHLPECRVHFVAHSFGGIVLMHLFHLYPRQRPGRLVLVATPVAGSEAARRLWRNPLTRPLLGRSVVGGLLGGAPAWQGEPRDLGVIAGTMGIGLGMLLGGLQRPHDGTVALAETVVTPDGPRLRVAASHNGLLFSHMVARQVCAFLRTGAFMRV